MNDELELWVDIAGLEGKYQVSNLGNVKCIPHQVNHYKGGKLWLRERIMKTTLCGKYLSVDLGERNKKLIHRLVAIAFIPNPENKPCVNHKYGNTLDNRASQLEWVTYSENEKHSWSILGKKHHRCNLGKTGILSACAHPIKAVDKNGKTIGVYGSIAEAAIKLKLQSTNIGKVLLNKRKTSGGYFFERITKDTYLKNIPTPLSA